MKTYEYLDNNGNYIDYFIILEDNKKMLRELEEKDKEIERLKNGYCKLKEKCNNGECDCTNEEYDGMVQTNMKLSLEIERLNKIINIKTNRIQQLMKRLSKRQEKVDRLNNIIEELEKWLKEKQTLYGINQQGFSWGVCGDALEYLKELKEGK